MKEIAEHAGFRSEVIRRAAPTGVAAYQNLKALQAYLEEVAYLIIDEKSMVGLRALSFLDRRLREIFPSRASDLFAGMNIVLIGDFYQLPPVGEHPLYSTTRVKDPDITRAQELYKTFRRCLDHLRVDAVTIDAWRLMPSRVQSQISNASDFDDAIRIYAWKESVRQHNHTKLRDLNVPVVNNLAEHTGHARAADVSTEEAGNLQATFAAATNGKIMLLKNLWKTQGLVDAQLYHGNQLCTQIQFPLVLDHAITVHKSQGVSLDQAVLNISLRDFAPGLTYVAISRMRHEDAMRRRRQEVSIPVLQQDISNSDDDLPLAPLSGNFSIPIRRSSPVRPDGSGLASSFFSETFGATDIGLSEMPVPLT
ncbi:hypothetical protein LEMA_P105610.1 [Plenodomus lingam JN3]|uniref:ATP-dependent DNA helicase n=1 Tax=Leptosphaeria maculans (strain JN3 / isolate v23.1.3 / race Av1-4-5-6-7-8) TaxID=985895 RepID=E5A1G6_LEPMJ|nr:hypothetical protein LEMA_P105610.1 [Plenodomus lingam JN3]CBX97430.1 hypothetical protein LEMA_P105610.1 [Plenodomus lingam JN3]